VLALDASNIKRITRSRRNQKNRILATILRFAEYLNRAMKNFLADLRTQILKRFPADTIER
jgi:hypothetical protein